LAQYETTGTGSQNYIAIIAICSSLILQSINAALSQVLLETRIKYCESDVFWVFFRTFGQTQNPKY